MTESESESTRLLQARRFKDSVHDYVSFSPWICSFIDTKHFQRLRYIKQLGLSYYVFPGAAHNRFEHCLGVGYLARLMATHLRTMDPSLGIEDHHIDCVELAGLCHDLGHGPWSHVWDNTFIPTALPGKVWKHEMASEMMFDDMVNTYQLDISRENAELVKALIAGEPKRSPVGEKMPFLFEIVANQRNGLDVDKFDYILRDCHAVGDRGNISITRLIHSARVVEGKICYDIKDANQIYELFYTRFSLHKRIYNHKTTIAIEYMVMDALLLAEPHIKIAQDVDNPKRYVYLTDDLLNRIESSTDKELEPAQAIIERIRTRDIYKVVDYKVFSHADQKMIKNNVTPEAIVDVAKSGVLKGVDEELVEQLTPWHVAVKCSVLHYGKGAENPLDFVTFYSKKKPTECSEANYSDISLLMPSSFAEAWLRIYTKDDKFHGLVQAAYRHILKSLVPSDFSPASTALGSPIGIEVELAEEAGEAQMAEDGFDPDVLLGGDAEASSAVMKIQQVDDAFDKKVGEEGKAEELGGDDDLDIEPIKPSSLHRPSAGHGRHRSLGLGLGPAPPLTAPSPSTQQQQLQRTTSARRAYSRNLSTASVGSACSNGGRSRGMGRTSSFSENRFTEVPVTFRGESPTRRTRSKRGWDVRGPGDEVVGGDAGGGENARPRKTYKADISGKTVDAI